MFVKQISVFVENAPGRLLRITKILSDNDINIRALSIADTTDFGILRLIVQNPEKAAKALKEQGITAKSTDVLVVGISDDVGGLSAALAPLADGGVTVEYMYAFVTQTKNRANVILKTSDPEKAVKLLNEAGIEIVTEKDVYEL